MTTNEQIDARCAGHRISVKRLFPIGADLAAELLDESNGALIAVAEDGTVRCGVCYLQKSKIADMIATARMGAK